MAAGQISEFKDGVWLIELAQLADPTYVLSAIASTFHLRELQGVPLIDTVTDYLRGKQSLLVLDNCEHLIETCARLAEHFLHACPKLKIITSSREALGIDGETVYRVPSFFKIRPFCLHSLMPPVCYPFMPLSQCGQALPNGPRVGSAYLWPPHIYQLAFCIHI